MGHDKMNQIHDTALIGDNVVIGDGNIIAAYCIIGGPYYRDNKDCNKGKVFIGNNNTIGPHAIIASPMNTKETRIGNDNGIYDHVYIGHDVRIYNHVTITASSALGGHTVIRNHAFLGLGTVTHPRISVGRAAMVGMGSVVIRNVMPSDKVVGVPARSLGFVKEVKQKFIRKCSEKLNTLFSR